MKKSSFKRSLALFMAILMLVTSAPIMAFATDQSGVRPADGITEYQPYINGVGDGTTRSGNFRIPSMVTLDSGTIVTAAEARWGAGMDGGGNDTVVSRSTDGGNTWKYSYVNYYGDNGNTFNKASTSTCDQELVTDGTNVYLLTTFFPAGYALNGSSANNQVKSGDTAFVNINGVQRVKLFKYGAGGSYNYYVGDFNADGAAGRAPIMNNDGTETGYYVDHDYYIYNGTTKTGSNLFYSDGEFQTAKVNFLLFRKSTDEGKTWSDFIPVPAKVSDEAFLGVGPGRGIYDADHGRIIFSTYSWDGSNNSQRSSFIYTDDEGQTWHRAPNFPKIDGVFSGNWSSENALVQLDADTIRCFVRNGWKRMTYCDAKWNGSSYEWQSYKDGYLYTNGTPATGDIGSDSGCQLSAIKYSKQLQYNGNYYDAILLSTPRGSRSNGVVYTLLIDDDENHTIVNLDSNKKANDKQIIYTVNTSFYAYSCLTELKDGSLALLYENEAANIRFSILPEVNKITGLRIPNGPTTYNYTLPTGSTSNYLVKDKSDVTLNEYAHISYTQRKSVNANLGDSEEFTGVSIPLSDAAFTFTREVNGQWTLGSMGVYMTVVNPGLPSAVKRESVTVECENGLFRFIDNNSEALYFHRNTSKGKYLQYDQSTAHGGSGNTGSGDKDGCLFEVYRPTTANETGQEDSVLKGFVRINSMDELKDGGQYIIGCKVGGNYYFLYPSTSTTNTYSHSCKVNTSVVDAGYYMTVQADNAGSFTLPLGEDTYNFTFMDFSNEILGVIEYDPVIYTHGTANSSDMDFTYVGNRIADGTFDGEKSTYFRFRSADYDGDGTADDLSKHFRVNSVSAVKIDSNESAQSLNFKYDSAKNEYLLSGNLDVANTSAYVKPQTGEYVDIKTTLEDVDTHEIFTQTDRLYVTSNPVAGHVLSAIPYHYTSGLPTSSNYHKRWPFATYIIAPGSIGDTRDKQNSDTYTYRLTNAKHIFNPANYPDMTLHYGSGDIIYSEQSNDNIKYAGYVGVNTLDKSGTGQNKGEREVRVVDDSFDPSSTDVNYLNGYKIGTYYLDVSSPAAKNMGINGLTKNSDNSYSFNVEFQRKTINYNFSQESSNDIQIEITGNYSGNRSAFDSHYGNGDRSLIIKTSGDGNINTKTYAQVFGASGSTYYIRQNGNPVNSDASTTADCTTVANIQGNTAYSLRGALRYHETRNIEKGHAWNDILFPFEIKYCDKSAERNVYENSIKNVLRSTEYTATTWEKYMNNAITYQEYLNNYVIQTKDQYTTETNKSIDATNENFPLKDGETIDIPQSYSTIQKRADFSELLTQIDDKQAILDNGLMISNDTYYTPSSFVKLDSDIQEKQAYYDGKGVDTTGQGRNPDKVRADLAGWEIGPYSQKKTALQNEIDNQADDLKSKSVSIAADDSVYVAAKEEYSRIDKTAYTDGGTKIDEAFAAGDSKIYVNPAQKYPDVAYFKNYDRDMVDVTVQQESEEKIIDSAITEALTQMTVATEKANVKQYKVTINANGAAQTVKGVTGLHNYGEIVYIDFSPYFDAETQNIECVVTSYRENEKGEKVPTTTTANLSYYADKNYIVPILIQNDIEFTVTATDKAVKQATIVDYYGTVIGTLTGETVTVDTASQTVTDGIQTIKAKNSPKYSFTGWSLADNTYPITEGMVISQVGTLIPGACIINANGGTVNTLDVFNSNQLNLKLTLAANNPNAIWTRTVDGKETLASYEANFVNFSSGADVLYKAYDNIDALPTELKTLAESNTPAINGVGYYANGKFTLSVDYSAPVVRVKDDKGNDTDELVVNVLDAGIIFTTTNPENLYKGGEGTTTYAAPRIAHWSSDSVNAKNSGTFTMSTSKNIDGAYMRAYVSYTLPYGKGTTLPYVAYSDTVYKCEKQADGSYKVTAVN